MKKKGPKPNQKKRRRWQQIIEQWRKSGLSRREFCKRRGISPNTLDYYRYKLNLDPQTKAPKTSPFIKVEGVSVPGATVRAFVHLPGGISVEIPELDLSLLKKLA